MKYPIRCFLPAIVLALASCATNTGDPARDARGAAANAAMLEAGSVLGQAAVSALFNAATRDGAKDAGGGLASAAAQGLWQSVGASLTSAKIGGIVSAWSAGKLRQTASAAAQAFQGSARPAPEKASAIAAVISTAAGAPPGG